MIILCQYFKHLNSCLDAVLYQNKIGLKQSKEITVENYQVVESHKVISTPKFSRDGFYLDHGWA